jgi:hypothetical protein
MPIVGAVVLSLMIFVSFTGSQQIQRNLTSHSNANYQIPARIYEPPARKSIVTANDGQVYTMAGLIPPTRRDRSQSVRYSSRLAPEPRISMIEKDFALAPPPAPKRLDTPFTQPLFVPADIKNESLPTQQQETIHLTGTEVTDTEMLSPDDSYLTLQDKLITNQIRQSIMDDNVLYIVSMHIRIDTTHGKVTLRGEVSTSNEKDVIGDKAAKIAGADNVSNQLIVLVDQNH